MIQTKNISLWFIAFIFLVISINIFLLARALDEDRWSDNQLGDAQTMLSARHWNKEGWLYNKLLFVPQGYAKVVYYFDEPELRHHAHGINPEASPLLTPRLRYTHYPPGYLFPYAFLMRIGFGNISWFRFLSIIFSTIAVILMFAVFRHIANPSIAFFASGYYLLSRVYIGSADTLANQPVDDMFRFAFMFFILLSTRADPSQKIILYAILAWITEFLLSLSSFDSVFFVYVWLICWDFIEGKGFRWKRYLLFALAPISAHSLQFLQNIWYLGYQDAVNDVIGTFATRSEKQVNFLTGIYLAFVNNFGLIVPSIYLLLACSILYLFYFYFKNGKKEGLPSILVLGSLFISGSAFSIILTQASTTGYHGRQFLPFVSFIIGSLTVSLFRELWDFLKTRRIKAAMAVYLLITSFFIIQFWQKNIFHKGWDLNMWNMSKEEFNKHPDIYFAKYIRKSVKTKFEPVFFDIGRFFKYSDMPFVKGYPQIAAIIEYYVNAPVLSFEEPEALAKDLEYLFKRSDYAFSPVIVTKGGINLNKVLSILGEKGYIDIARVKETDKFSADQYVILDLTNYLNVEKVKWLKM